VLPDPENRFALELRRGCGGPAAEGQLIYEDGMHRIRLDVGEHTGAYVVGVRARTGLLDEAERYRLNINVVGAPEERAVR
jgi:hypothetical protein